MAICLPEVDLYRLQEYLDQELIPAMRPHDYHVAPTDLMLGLAGCHSNYRRGARLPAAARFISLEGSGIRGFLWSFPPFGRQTRQFHLGGRSRLAATTAACASKREISRSVSRLFSLRAKGKFSNRPYWQGRAAAAILALESLKTYGNSYTIGMINAMEKRSILRTVTA